MFLLVTKCGEVQLCCLTAAHRHRRDLQRVRVGGANSLLLILSGHLDCLTDKWQLLTGDHMVFSLTVDH